MKPTRFQLHAKTHAQPELRFEGQALTSFATLVLFQACSKRLEADVESLRGAPLTHEYEHVYVDATFVDARWARQVENVSGLVAYGVGEDGHRQLFAVTIGAEEFEARRADLLGQLIERGLCGVRFYIAGARKGLRATARRLLPEAKDQRRTVRASVRRAENPLGADQDQSSGSDEKRALLGGQGARLSRPHSTRLRAMSGIRSGCEKSIFSDSAAPGVSEVLRVCGTAMGNAS